MEWDRKVSAVQELPLQIVALSSARVYLLDGGGGAGGGEMTRQTIIFLRGVLADWKVALVLPALHGLREVNVKFHSK